ncbi:hypothetical protein DNTS_009885 [Danionella cerebrum]|uniref:tRNA-dihydrouridine(47) synthase [NAD(P)(+)] n=1 Tax=Danionella cerebrum TaxID=2873325 RepID=A0A553NJP9_9TELE|nr:hypothetical protein DNTS_009885 [Danionella translucida]
MQIGIRSFALSAVHPESESAVKELYLHSWFLTTKEHFHEFLSSRRSVQSQDGTQDSEPERKRMKMEEECDLKEKRKENKKMFRGQNKSRPRVKPHSYEEKRLCPSIVQERDTGCSFGDKCRFLHDVGEYMLSKAADLGDRCPLFSSQGKCPYGVTCRFARAHTSAEMKNLVNEEVFRASSGQESVRNLLDKDLQRRLRKKSEDFPRTQEFLQSIRPEKKIQTAGPEEKLLEHDAGAGGDAQNGATPPGKTVGPITDDDIIKLRPCEKKQVDFRDKLYLAPLTTVGNLPFRRVCKLLGADITCGEMAVCTNLLQGQASEWALLKRHCSEDLFGVQVPPQRAEEARVDVLIKNIQVDFVDINSGCPIDLVYKKGGGCGLMTRTNKFEQIVRGMNSVLDVPLTVKIRTGVQQNTNIAHKLIPEMKKWGVSLITLHGRSREQRYTKSADWDYIDSCARLAAPVPLFGNGDILTYEDAVKARETEVSGVMLGRGALIKPWLFTEIKENRHWDISSGERLDILRDFTNFGLEHWGSDTQGVEKTRNFLLEWLSFLCRYIPVGLLERVPQKINERPPFYMGRDYMETLMASQHVDDWIQISEMLLGPVPKNFSFLPKHKANSYK